MAMYATTELCNQYYHNWVVTSHMLCTQQHIYSKVQPGAMTNSLCRNACMVSYYMNPLRVSLHKGLWTAVSGTSNQYTGTCTYVYAQNFPNT